MLDDYIQANPEATWEQMRNDNSSGGYEVAHECRARSVQDQKGLCAYCEQEISSDDPLRCRVEHFHPKSDRDESHNWSLDWKNMLAVCDGGSWRIPEENVSYPLPENLSCDAHKGRMIDIGKIPQNCEGRILNPLEAPAFPNIFTLDKGTGCLKADDTYCIDVVIPGNTYETTVELVDQTIAILNLNCDRLTEKRILVVRNIEHNKKTLRKNGITPADMPSKLINRYFNKKWPEFFTTIRCCLGKAVDTYLESINYQG